MKKKQVTRRVDYLRVRHAALTDRFMDPIAGISAWDTDSYHQAFSWVLLLHSELERSVEQAVLDIAQHAENCTAKYRPHAALVNIVSFYRGEVAGKMPELLPLIPPRSDVASDANLLLECWRGRGAKVWFDSRLARNHGAGLSYLAHMLHPVGLQVIAKEFRRTEKSRGLDCLGVVLPAGAAELGSFVQLRGAVAHGGFVGGRLEIGARSPADLLATGVHAVDAVAETAMALRRCWELTL